MALWKPSHYGTLDTFMQLSEPLGACTSCNWLQLVHWFTSVVAMLQSLWQPGPYKVTTCSSWPLLLGDLGRQTD